MKKQAVTARSVSTKQGAAPQGTTSEKKSVVGSNKGPAATSKSLAPRTRQWVWLLVGLGIIAILVITALIIGLVFLTTTTVAPAVCQSRGGEKVPEKCIIPSTCNQQCVYYSYKWPFKNDSITNGSFSTTSHECQADNGQKGLCNTEGVCVPNEINSNARESRSTVDDWEDSCEPNPCWDAESVKMINGLAGRGVVNLTECKEVDLNIMQQHCQQNVSAVLWVQHRRCEGSKRCNGPPFQVWRCGTCFKSGETFVSCKGIPNGVTCNPGRADWFCLGGECVKIAGNIEYKPQSKCG